FASAYAPLDESLSRVVVDLGRRPFLSYNVGLRGRIGTLESEVVEEFWRALSIHLGATIHVDLIRGRNRHHVAESTFKDLGLALPGVGALPPALGRLMESGLGPRIAELPRLGKPVRGVCLGDQLVCAASTGHGRHAGLGLLRGRVVEFAGTHRMPVIGWCRVA